VDIYLLSGLNITIQVSSFANDRTLPISGIIGEMGRIRVAVHGILLFFRHDEIGCDGNTEAAGEGQERTRKEETDPTRLGEDGYEDLLLGTLRRASNHKHGRPARETGREKGWSRETPLILISGRAWQIMLQPATGLQRRNR
jgi:hypothetical protein